MSQASRQEQGNYAAMRKKIKQVATKAIHTASTAQAAKLKKNAASAKASPAKRSGR